MSHVNSALQNNFYTQWLPRRTRRYVEQISKKTGAPIPMIVLMLLTAYSEAGQGVYDLQMPDGSISPLGLYCLVIAESGEGKSAVLDLTRKAIVELEHELADQYNARIQQFTVDEKIWKTTDDALARELAQAVRKENPTEGVIQRIKQHQETRPKKPRLIKFSYSKFTPEAFLLGLKNNWPNAGIDLDEANMFFNGRAANDLSPLLHGWGGKNLSKDTSAEHTTVFVKSPRIAGVFALQNSALQSYFDRRSGEARGLGLWARFLVCQPESTQGFRDIESLSLAIPELDSFHERMRALILSSIGPDSEPVERQLLRFDPGVAEFLIELGQRIETSMAPDGPLLKAKDHASKKIRNIMRVAAALTLFETDGKEIKKEFVESAEKIMDYCSIEFLKIFTEPDKPSQLHQDAEALWKWMDKFARKYDNRYILKSELLKLVVPTRLRSVNELDPVIKYLVETKKIIWGSYGFHGLSYVDLEPMKSWNQMALEAAINRYRYPRKKTRSFREL
ncbi:YfjI family protein [Chitinibacter sp. S2-10]|uniref:YfjI family protein n=1 Tax=Chitinibacter sp. S2-10 TaxID=3373597 RepID=UPI003977DFCE